MSLLTSLSNKINYIVAQNVSDPQADAYAEQQAIQAEQNKKVKDAEAAKAKAEAKAAADKKESDEAAAALAARSKFSPRKLAYNAANGILKAFLILFVIGIAFYGGHIVANKAIGYSVPFRILTFLYGSIFSFWIIPKSLYDVYAKGEILPYYSFLPLVAYEPAGIIEQFFIGAFCYNENESSKAATNAVTKLYSDAYTKSLQ
jgi:hypothetical protein